MSISNPVYFATVWERDWELDVFIWNRIGISAACAYIIQDAWTLSSCCYRQHLLCEVEGGDSSVASFMASVDECISERECKLYDEGPKK